MINSDQWWAVRCSKCRYHLLSATFKAVYAKALVTKVIAMPVKVLPTKLPVKIMSVATYQGIETPDDTSDDTIVPMLRHVRAGVLHEYRSSYSQSGIELGPYEQVLSVGPEETVEIAVEIAKRATVEQESESRIDASSSSEQEDALEQEFTDRVTRTVQRTESSSTTMSVGASYAVVSAGLPQTKSVSNSQTDSTEKMKRTLKQARTKVQSQMAKSYSIRIKRTEEITSREVYRRVIQNTNKDTAKHFGLRRGMQIYNVYTQYMGPRLAWETYVPSPGLGLGTPRLITEDFLPAHFIQDAQSHIRRTAFTNHKLQVNFANVNDSSTGVVKQTVDEYAQALTLCFQDGNLESLIRLPYDNVAQGAYAIVNVKLMLRALRQREIEVFYTAKMVRFNHPQGTPPGKLELHLPTAYLMWTDPSDLVVWDPETTAPTLSAYAAKYAALLGEMDKVQRRNPGDLRQEERDELMRRVTASLYVQNEPNWYPEAVSNLVSLFDINAAFYTLHPWSMGSNNFGASAYVDTPSRDYDLLGSSNPKPAGYSLGWKMQLDGDGRRNEILNSPGAKVVVPIARGCEKRAIELIKKLYTDNMGVHLGVVAASTNQIITELEQRWNLERIAADRGYGPEDVDKSRVSPIIPLNPVPDVTQLSIALYPVTEVEVAADPLTGVFYEAVEVGA